MPKLHQYFGSPITTFFFNIIHRTKFNDIHCGMRGISLNALKKIDLKSKSWQYASEMIIKVINLNIKSVEIPINFHKSKKGRQSNLKRIGWWEPWYAGWITIETILTWGIDRIFYKPGIYIFFLSYFLILIMTFLDNDLFFFNKISLHSLTFLLLTLVIGLEFYFLGLISNVIYLKDASIKKVLNFFNFNNSMIVSASLFIIGLFFIKDLIIEYISNNFILSFPLEKSSFSAIFGVSNLITSLVLFKNSLIINLLKQNK